VTSEPRYWEDYAIGSQIDSASRTITETDLIFWSGIAGDWNPAHVDVVHAATTPFGQRIAHGNIAFNLSVSLSAGTVPNAYRPEGFVSLLGWEDVRFTAPVFIGDTIRAERRLERREPGADDRTGVLVYAVRVFKDADELVMVGTERLLLRRGAAENSSEKDG
jgi:acyl dehydratase